MRSLRTWVLTAISSLLMMVPTLAYGQTLTAMWDPNPPSDAVTSYGICIGTTSLSCNFQSATVPASETSYTFAPSPGVLYYVAVRSSNVTGPGPFSNEVTISIPGLTQPANQSSQVNVAISPLSLSASDPDGGTIQFTHSGLPFGLTLNQSTGIITGTPTSAGTSNVTIFVSDDSVTTSRSFVWTVTTGSGGDTTAPMLAITSHTAGQTVSSSSITLAGTATDNGLGGTGITSVTVNGTAATGGAATGSNTANWNHAVTLAAGANTFTIVATDGTGNVRTSGITINRTTADASAPTLSITSHTSGQTVSSPTITLSGTATDNGTGGSGIASVTLNGVGAVGGAASGNGTANWSRSITLAAGANTVTVIATDGAGNGRTIPITLVVPTSPANASTLSANRTSPQPVGTTVTFSASASGGTSPYSYKWWVKQNGGAWSLLQDWNTSTTLAWTPNASGTYAIGVWARSNGVTADGPQTSAIAEFGVSGTSTPPSSPSPSAPPPSSPTYASLAANRTSPQPVGTTVTFSASASGGTSPYSYKWWVKQNGGAWTLLQDWSTSTTLAWTPNASGTYAIGVWARSNGVTADGPQTSAIAEFGVSGTSPSSPPPSSPPPSAPPPASPTYASVAATRTSPQPVGTTVTFSAGASGGASPYSYKWWVKRDGGTWTLLQDWSTNTTLAWTPNVSGTYAIGIWARSNGVAADQPQSSALTEFVVSAPLQLPPPPSPSPLVNPPTSAWIGVDRPGPQPTGTALTFSASASGGASPYSYKWWVKKDGGPWTVLRDWSTSATLTLTPTTSGAYAIGIWARSNGVTADLPQTSAILEFSVRSP
jgi:hypothetical protein